MKINKIKISKNIFILVLSINIFKFKINEKKNFFNKNGKMLYFDYEKKFKGNSTCDSLDPINIFKLRLENAPIEICNDTNTKHICYKNNKGYYNKILVNRDGIICIMENIIINPFKSNQSGLIYKGPVDRKNKGFPILSKGFINTKCKTKTINFKYNKLYEQYLNSWDYDYNIKNNNETLEELAPGKTIFLLSRNQDSPNLYHGNCEIINAISMLYLFNLSPEEVQVIFIESIEIPHNLDPFYEIYKNLISRGGEPLYIKNLKKRYKIGKAIHVPIIWDSTAFTRIKYLKCNFMTKTYKLYNDLIDKYFNLKPFEDKFSGTNEDFYYPKKIIKSNKKKIKFKKIVTIQWRKVWPKGRKGQHRLLKNGPQLADKLSSILSNNIMIRLINTASLSIREQISIIRSTDYLVGIHGAGLSLSIFLKKKAILHEISNKRYNHLITTLSYMSGHITYSDIIKSYVKNVNGNEYISFDENDFSQNVLIHMKENKFLD